MALTLTPVNKVYLGQGAAINIYLMTAASSGDTITLTTTGGIPLKVEFMDANANQIATSPPTCGTWSTSGGFSTCTVTANAGGVVTLGRCLVYSGGN